MLFFSPLLLIDVGFQLSVAATLGILFIKPLLPKHMVLEDFSTTIAAQLATIPILLTSFGQYAMLSILVNLLILWTIPVIMVLGGIGAICAFFFPFLGQLFIQASYPLLWYIEKVVTVGAVYGWGIHLSIPWSFVLGYYFLLVSVVVSINLGLSAPSRQEQ